MKWASSAYCPACGGPSSFLNVVAGYPKYRCEGAQQDGEFIVESRMMLVIEEKKSVPKKRCGLLAPRMEVGMSHPEYSSCGLPDCPNAGR